MSTNGPMMVNKHVLCAIQCKNKQKSSKIQRKIKQKSNKINTAKPKEKQAISPKFHEKIKQN